MAAERRSTAIKILEERTHCQIGDRPTGIVSSRMEALTINRHEAAFSSFVEIGPMKGCAGIGPPTARVRGVSAGRQAAPVRMLGRPGYDQAATMEIIRALL